MKLAGLRLLLWSMTMMVAASGAFAQTGALIFADSAPNSFGTPGWSTWWNPTSDAILAGTFRDMQNGTQPGTRHFDPSDETMYAGGGGRQLRWIFQVPDLAAANAARIEVKVLWDWAGAVQTWDWVDKGWSSDDPDLYWGDADTWDPYDVDGEKGVLGSFGLFAMDAGSDDPAAFRSDLIANQTYAKGIIRRWYGDGEPGHEKSGYWSDPDTLALTMKVEDMGSVPEPTSMLLLGVVMAGSGALALRRRKR